MTFFLAMTLLVVAVSGATLALCGLVILGLRETVRWVRRRRVRKELDAYTRQYNLERVSLRR